MATSSNVRQFPMDTHRFAALLFASAERSRWAARECARGAAAAGLASIASVAASVAENAAVGVAVAFVLAGALLARRLFWLAQARSARHDALTAEITASFAASGWRERTKWGLVAGRRGA